MNKELKIIDVLNQVIETKPKYTEFDDQDPYMTPSHYSCPFCKAELDSDGRADSITMDNLNHSSTCAYILANELFRAGI